MKELSQMWNGLGDADKAKWRKKVTKAKAERTKEVEKYEKGKLRKQYLKEKKEYEEEMAEKRAKLVKAGPAHLKKRKLEAPAASEEPPAKKAKNDSKGKKKKSKSKSKSPAKRAPKKGSKS